MKLNDFILTEQYLEEQLQYLPEGIADVIRKLPTKYKKATIAAAIVLFPTFATNFSIQQLKDIKNAVNNISDEYVKKVVQLLPVTEEDKEIKITKQQLLRAVDAQLKLHKQEKEKRETYTSTISDIFKGANKEVIAQVVDLAHKYQRPDFPRAEDILSVVAIESSFNPKSVSKLKKDPAIGLTQIRPGMWKIPKEELKDIENQIKHGVNILSQYYDKLKDKKSAIVAYNKGIAAYKKGDFDTKYLDKFQRHYTMLFGKKKHKS